MDTYVTAHSTIESETSALRARLPGEPQEAPVLADSAGVGAMDGPMAPPGLDPGKRPVASSPPKARRRRGLLAGAAVVALAAASASAFLISPYNHVYSVPRMASAVRHAASSAGIRIPPEIVAPSAKLADVAVPRPVPIIRAPYTPAPPSQDMHELLALHAGGPVTDTSSPQPPTASGLPAEPGVVRDHPPGPVPVGSAPAVHPAQTASGAPSDRSGLGGPPPGYVPAEPGSEPPSASPAMTPRAEPVATPQSRLSQAATPPAVAQLRGAQAPTPPLVPAEHDLTREVLAALHPIVVAPTDVKPSSTKAGTTSTTASSAPADEGAPRAPKPATDAVAIVHELHPGPMTPKDQVAVLGVVTELATLVGDLRSETRELRNDMRSSAADDAARLGDLERRMAMVEARDALSNARDAGTASDPADPAPTPAGAQVTSPVNAVPVRLSRADAASPRTEPETLTRYKVQAASPGLAMLAQVDRGGGDGAQIEVRVGDSIPGYGRVKSIGQKGSTWVVTTEHGDIS
jgi:hypothetical protein